MNNKENLSGAEQKPPRSFDFKKMLLPILMVVLATLLIITAVLFRDEKSEEVNRQSKTLYGCFDTVSVIYDYSGDSVPEFERRCTLVENTLRYYHGLLDIYNDKEGVSGLYEINVKAGIEPVAVGSDVIDFLEFSKQMYTLTGGEVNIAMGAVTSLWHKCRADAADDPVGAKLPDGRALSEAALHCDINNLVIDREAGTVYLADEKMRLDPGALGKGYATERATDALKLDGAESYLLDIGGNVRAVGAKPSGNGFNTGIKDPFGNGGYVSVIEISDSSAVTSGGYERYYYVEGQRYHHIIDKDTLTSPDTFASVTVLTKDSGFADALSTALFCMDLDEGRALVGALDGVKAVWVMPDGTIIECN